MNGGTYSLRTDLTPTKDKDSLIFNGGRGSKKIMNNSVDQRVELLLKK